jgi:hypothetical protein
MFHRGDSPTGAHIDGEFSGGKGGCADSLVDE